MARYEPPPPMIPPKGWLVIAAAWAISMAVTGWVVHQFK